MYDEVLMDQLARVVFRAGAVSALRLGMKHCGASPGQLRSGQSWDDVGKVATLPSD